MADLMEDLEPSVILQNPIYLTLVLGWLPPVDILSCAPVCKHWSTGVLQTWKSFLQRISPELYSAIVEVVNQNQVQVPPDILFKQFTLNEYRLRQDVYSLPTDTFENYRRTVANRELKQRHKDAILTMDQIFQQSLPRELLDPPTLKLEDLLLVVHIFHVPTRTPLRSVIWKMDEVLEDGFIYGKEAPVLTKEVDLRVPAESVTETSLTVPLRVFPEGPGNFHYRRYIDAGVSVQMYRCDIGKSVNFERAKMMEVGNVGCLLGCVRSNLRKSRIDPNPASFPLPAEDDQYFDPSTIPQPMSAINKQYPSIGFEVGFGNDEPVNGSPSKNVCRMKIEVRLRLFELFPGHHRTTIRWKEDLRKHLQYMDWE